MVFLEVAYFLFIQIVSGKNKHTYKHTYRQLHPPIMAAAKISAEKIFFWFSSDV